MTREQQILRSILAQRGVIVPCFRCGVTLSVDDAVQKEHLHERALGGPDMWGNWRWSHKDCHRIVTDGAHATSAGSSKHRIAKAKRIEREAKFIVVKELSGGVESSHTADNSAAPRTGSRERSKLRSVMSYAGVAPGPLKPKRWPSRKLKSRGFQKGHRPMRRNVA